MKANEVQNIVRSINESPYRCILIDGDWGIGKTHELKYGLEGIEKSCNISLFGIKNNEEIYKNLFSEFFLKNGKLKGLYNKLSPFAVAIFEHFGVESALKGINRIAQYKALSHGEENGYIIAFDDLERVGEDFKFEEFLGLVEKILSSSKMKIILIANIGEFKNTNKEIYEKYREKVIDKIYKIDELSTEIEWSNLGVNDSRLAKDCIKKYDIRNLRTIKKSENFYKDVNNYLEKNNIAFKDEHNNIVKSICYAIVIEDIHKYGEEALSQMEKDNEGNDNTYFCAILKNPTARINHYYLNELRINGFEMITGMIYSFYTSNKNLDKEVFEAGFNAYNEAGKKHNFYKSDKELVEMIDKMKRNFCKDHSLTKAITDFNIIGTWMVTLGLDYNIFFNEAEESMKNLICERIRNDEDVNIDLFHYSFDTEEVRRVIENIFSNIKDKQLMKILADTKCFIKEKNYQKAYDCIKDIKERFWQNITEEMSNELLIDDILPLGSIDEYKWMCFREVYTLCKKNKNWNLYYKKSLKKYKNDKAFVNRMKALK